MCRCREVMSRREREVRLSPSMMAREIHRTQPVAPFFQSPMGPGAQPLCRATGPSIPYPTRHTSQLSTTPLQPWGLTCTGQVTSQTLRRCKFTDEVLKLWSGGGGGGVGGKKVGWGQEGVMSTDKCVGCLCGYSFTAFMAACARRHLREQVAH